ncbi:hypothetical protein BURMUCF2_0391, partial [Burkholderia multivorans CF2]
MLTTSLPPRGRMRGRRMRATVCAEMANALAHGAQARG